MIKNNYLEKLNNSKKPFIIYKSDKGFDLYTDFSKKIILNNKNIKKFINKNTKLKFIGEINKLPLKLKKLIKNSETKTSKNISLQVNVALNYGSKKELINSIKMIHKKKIKINEKNIDKNLFNKG